MDRRTADVRTDGQAYGRTGERTCGRTSGRTDGRTGQTDERTDGRMDEWTDGRNSSSAADLTFFVADVTSSRRLDFVPLSIGDSNQKCEIIMGVNSRQ